MISHLRDEHLVSMVLVGSRQRTGEAGRDAWARSTCAYSEHHLIYQARLLNCSVHFNDEINSSGFIAMPRQCSEWHLWKLKFDINYEQQ